MATVGVGDFEWDDEKAHSNQLKHRVSFLEAMEAFMAPRSINAPDRLHPQRFILIGMSRRMRVLFVVSAERGERIRLISLSV